MATQPPVTDAPAKIRLPKGTGNALANQSVGLLTILAACKAGHSRASTLVVADVAGNGEVTIAAIVPADQVRAGMSPDVLAAMEDHELRSLRRAMQLDMQDGGEPGYGQATLAAIERELTVRGWRRLRESVIGMRPDRRAALTDKESSIVDHVLKIVLDEMDTIERAE